MDKKEFVQNLKKIKLVIGNGFDIHCGLKTRYRDYFLNNKAKNDYFKNWLSKFRYKVKDYMNMGISNHHDSWLSFENFELTNIWDFFFYLVSDIKEDSQDDWKWCDIENVMLEWLFSETDRGHSSKKNWQNVFDITKGNNRAFSDEEYILAAIAYKMNNENEYTDFNQFCIFLLEELKRFEYSFGEYIYKQNYDPIAKSYGVMAPVTNFPTFARRTVNQLCKIENIVSVESFNYDFIGIDELRSVFNNINGNIDNPIFGIDSTAFLTPDPRYIFSKTNRRMELDMLNNDTYDRQEFENVIVYGHSLTSSDYSYFFSILDKLDISNFSKNTVIVFAYSIYDRSIEDKIKSDY